MYLSRGMALKVMMPSLAILATMLITGCGAHVGGKCSYTDMHGIVEVVSVNPESYTLKLTMYYDELWIERKDYQSLVGSVVGDRFHAKLLVRTEGSCAPKALLLGEPYRELGTNKN